MSTKNVTLKEKVNGAAGNVLFPATTTPNVYDSAKSQALSQTLVNTPDYEALGFAKFSTATAYNTGDKVYKDNGLYRFIADKTAGEWDVAKVEPWSIEQEIEEVDDAIRSLIPAQASADNKLADKAYVNDKVSTDTATFRGTFNLVTDLELTTEATQGQIATALGTAISGEDKNDYAFVQIPTSDATPTEIARIDRYKYTGLQWAFEYSLNNSGFTAEQWAAINSGITSSLVAAFGAKYDKPAGGIPASDMNTNTFDAEPTAGSNNLVKSGGVAGTMSIYDSITNPLPNSCKLVYTKINSDGSTSSNSTFTAYKLSSKPYRFIHVISGGPSLSAMLAFYNSDNPSSDSLIEIVTNNGAKKDIIKQVPETCVTILFGYSKNYADSYFYYELYNKDLKNIAKRIDANYNSINENKAEADKKIEDINKSIGKYTIAEPMDVLRVATISGNSVDTSAKNCICNTRFIRVKGATTLNLFHAADIKIRVIEYSDSNYIKQTAYGYFETLVLNSNTTRIRISADYSERGYSSENPITLNDYTVGDFGIVWEVSQNILDISLFNAVEGVPAIYNNIIEAVSSVPAYKMVPGMIIKYIEHTVEGDNYVHYRHLGKTTSNFDLPRNWMRIDFTNNWDGFFVGSGNNETRIKLSGIKPNRNYELVFNKDTWEITGITGTYAVVGVYAKGQDYQTISTIYSVTANTYQTDFTSVIPINTNNIPNIDSLELLLRAANNVNIHYYLRDITCKEEIVDSPNPISSTAVLHFKNDIEQVSRAENKLYDLSITVGTLYQGYFPPDNLCLGSTLYYPVKYGDVIKVLHASDISIRVAEYSSADGQHGYLRDSGAYAKFDTYTVVNQNAKFIRIAASYSERGFSDENKVSVNDYREGDFGVYYNWVKFVSVEEDYFSEEQKEIARKNIGLEYCGGSSVYQFNRESHTALVEAKGQDCIYPTNPQNAMAAFLVVTDIHTDWESFERALKYADDEYLIDNVFVLGDIGDSPSLLRNYDYENKVLECTKPVLTIPGNHEIATDSPLTNAEMMSKFYSTDMVTKNGDIHPEGKLYWYKDVSHNYYYRDESNYNAVGTKTLRVIGLCQADYCASEQKNDWYISQEQIDWLVNVLDTTPVDTYVLILTHSTIEDDNNLTAVDNKFTGVKNAPSYTTLSNKSFITNIVRAWINGTTVNETSANTVDDVILSVNHNFSIPRSNKFIGFLSGHSHRDYVAKINGTEAIYQINLHCTTSSNTQQNGDIIREGDGKFRDCLTVFVYDWFKHRIKLIRLGADITTSMKKRDYDVIYLS